MAAVSAAQVFGRPFSWELYFPNGAGDAAFLLFLFVLCRLFPLQISEIRRLDLGIVPAVVGVFLYGLHPTILLFLLSVFFHFGRDPETKNIRHLFLAIPRKQLFSLASMVCAIWTAGVFLRLFGEASSDYSTADLIVHVVVFLLIAGIIDILLQFLYIMTKGGALVIPTMSQLTIRMLPKLAFAAPLGVLFTILLDQPNGCYYSLVFLFPAALARYSYHCYLDSRRMHMRTIGALSRAIEAKDPYIRGHSQRVAFLSTEIGREMGLSNRALEEIKVAALLHDIGKIGIEDKIWNKPGLLTKEEFEEVKKHPTLGRQMIDRIGFSHKISDAIEYHHCYFDGSGYPVDSKMTRVPLAAAIISIADAYDAMTSDRPYRRRVGDETALRILRENGGKQFDTRVVEAFSNILAAQFEQDEEQDEEQNPETPTAKG